MDASNDMSNIAFDHLEHEKQRLALVCDALEKRLEAFYQAQSTHQTACLECDDWRAKHDAMKARYDQMVELLTSLRSTYSHALDAVYCVIDTLKVMLPSHEPSASQTSQLSSLPVPPPIDIPSDISLSEQTIRNMVAFHTETSDREYDPS